MKKSFSITIFLGVVLATLFLTACQPQVSGGEKPLDTAAALRMVQTGTQGVEIRTMPNQPPTTIYDENELVALVDVRNRGNYDLLPQDCFIQITGPDPNIVGPSLTVPRSCAENLGVLEGKSVYNTEGDFNQIEFRSSNVLLPQGVFEYNPTLKFVSCYHYHTTANPQVCIDPLFYQVTPEQKACDFRKSIITGGGQGAPVGVGYVGVEMTGGRAIFDININNLGGGTVLSPHADIRSCADGTFDRTEVDRVAYTTQLSGANLVDCNPKDGLVRLNNGQGKIRCTFNIPGSFAYETPLLIDLDYGYIKSYSQPIKIIQTPR